MSQNKSHKQCYRYYNDTYDATIYLYIGTKDDAYAWLKKKFKLHGANPVDRNYAGLSFTLTGEGALLAQVMWMPSFNFTTEDYNTLSHECLHTAINIMEDRGCESMGKGGSEEMAYFHSAIYGAMLDRLCKDRYGKEKDA